MLKAASVLLILTTACRRDVSATPAPSSRDGAHRIVSIAPDATEILYALGAGDRLAGVCTFCSYPEQVRALPRVGGYMDPNLERLLSLRPDLVIVRGTIETVETLCRANGIAVYKDPAESIADIERTVVDLGRLTGRTQAAAALVASMRAELEAVRQRVAGRARPRVLLTVGRRPDRLEEMRTVSRGTFLHELLELAGGINIFADQDLKYPVVSTEAILARRPAVIIEAMPESEIRADTTDAIRRQWVDLGPLPAVEGGRIHVLRDNSLTIPSPRITQTATRLAELLHPNSEPPTQVGGDVAAPITLDTHATSRPAGRGSERRPEDER